MAYADPPYLGCCARYDHEHGKTGGCWDDLDTHAQLVLSLADYDGWAMSASSPSLRLVLPLCPPDVRVAAWVKPFAVFKPGVNPAYAWEPVIWRGGRQGKARTLGRKAPTVRDWVSANITLKKGLCGAKPPGFSEWLFDLLGLEQGDEFHDIFTGTGAVGAAWAKRQEGIG
jgi:hypothetical protein